MPQDRRLAAIMFTDIVGYTALMGSDEDKAFEVLKKNHTIHENLINKYNGTLIKEIGDGTLASFPLASDAVRCAIEIQKESKEQNIPLKIGIHQGEMVMAGADVLGDGVNIASRLQEASQEGCITISGKVYSDIHNKAGIKTKYIREKKLKNVDDPVKMYEVLCEMEEKKPKRDKPLKSKIRILHYLLAGIIIILVAVIIWQFLPSKELALSSKETVTFEIDKSIAVIPFKNDSEDQGNEYFCNGMMEEILTHLQKIVDLNVKSRTSVEQYRNTTKTIKTIAKELDVPFVLEGSVRKYGDNFRITAQLIEAATGNHLWADTYDGAYTDTIFVVQANIAKRIAASLNAAITPLEREQIEKSPTSDIRAYEKYIKGRESLNRYWSYSDYKDFEMAENLFRESLEIDPEFAWGYSGMAQIYNFKAERLASGLWDSVNYYAEKTLEYDRYNGMGYGLRGTYFEMTGDLDKSLDSYKRAIEVDPNFPWYYEQIWEIYFEYKQDYRTAAPYLKKAEELTIKQKYPLELLYNRISQKFVSIGDYEKAKKFLKSSLEINPSCSSISLYIWLMRIHDELDKAIDFLDSMLVMEPLCEYRATRTKAFIYLSQKEFERAEEYLNLWIEYGNKPSESDSIDIAYMFKELGREQEALSILRNSRNYFESQLTEHCNFWTYLFLARIHAILDEKEEALKCLSKAAEFGFEFGWHDIIEIYPPFENLWDDPKFKAIVQQAQDEKAAIRAQIREVEEQVD